MLQKQFLRRRRIRMNVPNRNRLILFFSVLIASAILLIAVSEAAGLSPIDLAPIYMFSPMVGGLLVCWRYDLSLRAMGLRFGKLPWLLISAIIALPLIGLTLLLAVIVPDVGFDPTVDILPGIDLPSGLLGVVAAVALVLAIGVTINALFAFCEEFGWRGYLLWELAPLGFWKASFAIGAIWGLWHAPVILAGYNYPSYPILGVFIMVFACMAFSPLYTYLVMKSESVLAAAFLHGVFNASAGIVIAFAVTDSSILRELVASPVGLAGILAFLVATVGIIIVGTPSLSRDFATVNADIVSTESASQSKE